MANETHLALLREGLDAWQEWKAQNPKIKPDLSGADLSRAYLNGANLSQVNLIGANLSRATLSGANLSLSILSGANLSAATLWEAELNGAYLNGTNLRKANLSDAYLKCTNFFNADLNGANLNGANLNGAYFSGADLTGADLNRTQALNTNFKEAIFTGACLESWDINSGTNLSGVICDYVYLDFGKKSRFPKTGTFKVDEFAASFQKVNETVDLIFDRGINWEAFAQTFKNYLSEHSGVQLYIQSIEKQEDGVIIIRISIPTDEDNNKIHNFFMQNYTEALKALLIKNQIQLNDKNNEINEVFNLINQLNQKLINLTKVVPESINSKKPNIVYKKQK